MEQNYRSTKTIVEAANSIISNNKNQIKKKVWTANDKGDLIKVIKSFSDNEEGKQITANRKKSLSSEKQRNKEEKKKSRNASRIMIFGDLVRV